MTDALDAVIDAALERALLDTDDARQYLALAGALERGRAAAGEDGTGSQRRRHADPGQGGPTSPGNVTNVLGAALLSTVAVSALESAGVDGIDPGAWAPGGQGGGPRVELVAAGAAAACRRFDVELDTLADRSGLPPEQLDRHRNDGDTTGGPR